MRQMLDSGSCLSRARFDCMIAWRYEMQQSERSAARSKAREAEIKRAAYNLVMSTMPEARSHRLAVLKPG